MTHLEIALTVVAIGLAVYVSIQARKLYWQRWEIMKNLEICISTDNLSQDR